MLLNTFYSKNFNNYAQSAGNLHYLYKSSSETTRETSFSFNSYRKLTNINTEQISDDWLTWFVGFSEGDGALLTEKGNKCYFVLTQKEDAILYHICETLKIGRVNNFGKFSRFMVYNNVDINILISIFNGNLFLQKRKAQFQKWLNITNISVINNNFSPSLKDAWISGFIDAEGCFNVTLFKRKTMVLGYQVKLRFMIDQKESFDDMFILKNKLNLILTNRKLKKGITSKMHRIETNSIKKVPLIIQYINIFNLKTKKKESFHKWKKVYNMTLNKEHLNKQGLYKIRELSKQINLITSITKKTGSVIK